MKVSRRRGKSKMDEKKTETTAVSVLHGEERDAMSVGRIQVDCEKGDTALDILMKAKAAQVPDLSFRFGCRNRRCGLCAVEINGEARLGCASEVQHGDCIGPLKSLPIVRDLVVDRSGVDALLAQKTALLKVRRGMAECSPDLFHIELGRCIGCLACLSRCPLHAKNYPLPPLLEKEDFGFSTSEFRFGNPYLFLQLYMMAVTDEPGPDERAKLAAVASELGVETCLSCGGCRCIRGIPVFNLVVTPLLKSVQAL